MNIVVVGDVLLDVDMNGDAQRLCPDAPVPVVEVSAVERRAGGAGLVAQILAQRGHQVSLVTALSDDDASAQLRAALAALTVIAGPSGTATVVKTRLWANQHPVVRFDEGSPPTSAPEVTNEMITALDSADAIVVADYGRGLTSNSRLRNALSERAGSIPIIWDPHPHGATPVAGVAAITPNLAEARKAADVSAGGVAAAAEAAEKLLAAWTSQALVVTMGSKGALVRSGPSVLPTILPAPDVVVSDPCGAGDSFAAALAIALAQGTPLDAAVQEAVNEAAMFLAAGGVASLRPNAQPAALHSGGTGALSVAARTRDAGGTVVATGGCFDLLHAGHARTLSAARALGDALIVCLNSDESIRRLKGAQRPIIAQQDRAELLLSLGCVDAVMIFDEDTPEAVLSKLRPQLWVKGGDYTAERLPEAALLHSWGGQTVTVPYYPARSTTLLAQALARVG